MVGDLFEFAKGLTSILGILQMRNFLSLTRKWPSPHGATSIASLSAPTIAVNSWTVAPFPTANLYPPIPRRHYQT
jgi:hypothetical protein